MKLTAEQRQTWRARPAGIVKDRKCPECHGTVVELMGIAPGVEFHLEYDHTHREAKEFKRG